MELDPQEPGRRGGVARDAPGQDDAEASSESVQIPTRLDFVKREARRIAGLLELELGTERPWFVVFSCARNPCCAIIYHSPEAGNSVGYSDDNFAVGRIVIEICQRLGVSPLFDGK